MRTLVINLYAGPGAGKSTAAAQIFSELKWKGVNAELVTEYAKELVWRCELEKLKDQSLVYNTQLSRIEDLMGKVEVIVTDSPLLLSVIYGKDFKEADDCVYEVKSMDDLNIFLDRKKPYERLGRIQTEEEAIEIDKEIKEELEKRDLKYVEVDADKKSIESFCKEIYEFILDFRIDG